MTTKRAPINYRTSLKPIRRATNIRVIVDGVTLYMPAGNVHSIIGSPRHRDAVLHVLDLINMQRAAGVVCAGIATSTNVGNVNVQVDVL